MVNKLRLADVVRALREELDTAKNQAEGEDIRFNVNNIEVEFQTLVEWDTSVEGGGKIKFWVLDTDAKASVQHTHATTHNIKLSLEPIDTDSEKELTDEDETRSEKKVRVSGRTRRLSPR